jgi:hypothetical protein
MYIEGLDIPPKGTKINVAQSNHAYKGKSLANGLLKPLPFHRGLWDEIPLERVLYGWLPLLINCLIFFLWLLLITGVKCFLPFSFSILAQACLINWRFALTTSPKSSSGNITTFCGILGITRLESALHYVAFQPA